MISLGKIVTSLTARLPDILYRAVTDYFPPDMSEQQRETLRLKIEQVVLQQETQAQVQLLEAERVLTARISELEGTAADLKALPVIGRIILFARGCQRPTWGFFTLLLDWKWFSEWQLNSQQQTALIVINLLVLGFLFGERAIKNVAPYVIQALNNTTRKVQ